MADIQCLDLCKTYRQGDAEIHALDHVTLDIEPGSFICLSGPSGSGKTTLLNLVGCLDRPTSGRVTVVGRELSRLPGIRYRRPDGGFYYFIQVRGCTDSERLAFSILEKQRVITVPGVAFGPEGEGCLRLSFAAAQQEIVAGIARLARALDR